VLHALRWMNPSADAVKALTWRPVECLRLPADAETAYLVEVGRAAFRDPLLLGGQAARVGVACETCHRNGRTNPDFSFPRVSGRPGTADVTSFVFSSHRGDHLTDPRPIPDLGGPKRALKISQSPGSPALRTFIHGLITEEFDGHEPPAAVLDGLAAYVRAMDPAACSTNDVEPVTAGRDLTDVRRAMAAAKDALARGDAQTAIVMLQAARAGLGTLAERYDGPKLSGIRKELTDAAHELSRAADEARRPGPAASRDLAAWTARSGGWEARTLRAAPLSLYDRSHLAKILAARSRQVATE
jgi:hypothetical protein